jgi:hypothetical protein
MTKLLKIAALAGFMVVASNANALLIDLGVWPAPQGAGDANAEMVFLNSTVLPAYNNNSTPILPLATFGTPNINVTGEPLNITLDLTGWSYVKLKWGHNWQFYYIAGETGDREFESTGLNQNGGQQALSHYTFFGPSQNRVPDGGSTLMLMGLALSGLAVLKQAFRE